MSTVLRGHEGFPTGQDRGPAGPVDPAAVPDLPSAEDWQAPETAEAALEATRDALAAQAGGHAVEVDHTSESAREVDDMEQIEADVAPDRHGDEVQPPTPESSND